MKDHNATVHENKAEEAKIECPKCDEIFCNKDRLKDHNATVHGRQAEEVKIDENAGNVDKKVTKEIARDMIKLKIL